jgi:hypothetical protein
MLNVSLRIRHSCRLQLELDVLCLAGDAAGRKVGDDGVGLQVVVVVNVVACE